MTRPRTVAFLAAVVALMLAWQVRSQAALTGLSLNPTFASVAGGKVIDLSVSGSFTSLTATVDGASVPITTIGSRRFIVAPAHAAGAATVQVTANDGTTASATLTYVALPVSGLATAITRASLTGTGQQATTLNGNGGGSGAAVASGSAGFVAFGSDTDLGFGAPSSVQQFLYRKDLGTGDLLKFGLAGCDCSLAGMSLDGSRVLIRSFLIGGSSVYSILDAPFTGTLTRVDVNDTNTQGSSGIVASGTTPMLSANGQFFVFVSTVNVDGNVSDTAGTADLFVRDTAVGHTARWTLNAQVVSNPSISGDGRFLAFGTTSGLAPGDSNGVADVYLLDRLTQAEGGGSVPQILTSPSLNAGATNVAIASSGNAVAFNSAANLTANATGSSVKTYVFDRRTGSLTLASVSSGGVVANAATTVLSISGNGRRVLFSSTATSLTSTAITAVSTTALFVRDVGTNQTWLVNSAADGTWSDDSMSFGVLSPDGRQAIFSTKAPNLVAGDTNVMSDVFVKTLPPDVSAGSSVQADPFDPVSGKSPLTIVFPTVTAAGNVSLTASDSGTSLPAGYTRYLDYYGVSTTATTSGSPQVCVSYLDATPGPTSALRLLHLAGGTWEDITTSADGTAKLVCGATSSLGTFALASPPAGSLADPPVISSFSPLSGPAAGGTGVTISGTGFQTGATVNIGGINVASPTVAPTAISVLTPAHAAGSAIVRVTNPDGQVAYAPASFIYNLPPSVTSLSVTSGPSTGGTAVTVNGANFVSGATVTFGGVSAAVSSMTSTAIQVTTPVQFQGGVPVVVTNPDGQSSSGSVSFSYTGSAATLRPTFASTTGGTPISVNFTTQFSSVSVSVDGVSAPVTASSTTGPRRFAAPAHAAGATPVVITAPNGATRTLTLTYQDMPQTGAATPTSRVSLLASGAQTTAPGFNFLGTTTSAASADLRYFAFVSATDLGFGPPPSGIVQRIYVKDRLSGAVSYVHQCSQACTSLTMSADGATIAYQVNSNTTTGSLWVAKAPAWTPVRADVDALGNPPASGGVGNQAALSSDGRYLAFLSSSNLDANASDTNGTTDLFVRDLVGNSTQRLTLLTGAGQLMSLASISDDGRFVVSTTAVALVAGDTNSLFDAYLFDRNQPAGSQASLVAPGANNTTSNGATVSRDGSVVAFLSAATNLDGDDPNASVVDIYFRNVTAGTITRVASHPSAAVSLRALSPNGRRLAYTLAVGGSSTPQELLVRDLDTGLTQSAAAAADGSIQDSEALSDVSFSADSNSIVFATVAANLVPGDTNLMSDVFLKRLRYDQQPLLVSAPPSAAFNTSFDVSASGGSGSGVVTFAVTGVCSITGATVTMTSGTGTCVVTATRTGDFSYEPTSTTAEVQAVRAHQAAVLLANVPAAAVYGDTFVASASGGSGSGPYVFTATSPCANVGGASLITMAGSTGECTVFATRAGDSNYFDESSLYATVTATRYTQATLSVTAAPASAAEGASFVVSTSGGSGTGPVVFSVSGACDNSSAPDGAVVTITKSSGTCSITATKYGDSLFLDASAAAVTVDATPPASVDPTITSVSPSAATIDGGVTVTIAGANFTGDATVTFGGVPATSVLVQDAFTILAVAPPHAVASVDVVVSTLGNTRTATLAHAFAYGPAPEVGLHGAVVRVDLASDGHELAGGHGIGAMSADGRFVAFASTQDLGVPGDVNGRADLFLRDRLSGTTEQVNVSSAGAPGSGGTGPTGVVAISPDGRYVAFTTSDALDAGDTNGALDVYLRDRTLGLTERISYRSDGTQLPNGVVGGVSLTADGRYVAFVAAGTNVTPDDLVAGTDVFLRDRAAGTMVMLSVSTSGAPADAASTSPWMSADGRFVVFTSSAGNLGAGGGTQNVYLRDRDTDADGVFDEAGFTQTLLVSRTPAATGGNAASWGGGLSSDGAYVAFESLASDLVAADTNGVSDVFLFERATGAVTRLSMRPGNVQTTGPSRLNQWGGAVSADGRFVVFTSDDAALVPFDGNRASDVFRFDRTDGSTLLASAREDGSRAGANGSAIAPASVNGYLGSDGRWLLFASDGADFVDADLNDARDLFVKKLEFNTPPGVGVQAKPIDPTTGGSPVVLEFASVSQEGSTSLAVLPAPPANLPGGFTVGAVTYDITTTATFDGPIEICISYAGQDVGDESSLRMLHYDNGAWVDVTSRVDTLAKVVCGLTTSLSPFTIARPTATAVSVSATPSVYGGTTTLSATVTPAGVNGTVTFRVNGNGPDIASTYDASTGTATLTGYVHGLNASDSAYSVQARFDPAATNYAKSSAIAAVLSVMQAAAVVTFDAAPTPTYLGGNFTVSASTTNTDSGALVYSRVSGPCAWVSGATFSSSGAGTCVVRASGAATTNFLAALRDQAVTIAVAPTTTTVTTSLTPSNAGQSVTFTAAVSSAGGPVGVGTVTFKDGSTVLAGGIALDANGRAILTTSSLSAGSHTISATYGATGDFAGSSGSVAQKVNAVSTTYTFSGFFAPIDMPAGTSIVWNTAKAGQAIPVKWLLTNGGDPVTNPASFAGVYSYPVSCGSGTGNLELAIEEYAAGGSGLIYNGNGNWQYNWATPKSYANTCRVLYVKFNDGTVSLGANVKFK